MPRSILKSHLAEINNAPCHRRKMVAEEAILGVEKPAKATDMHSRVDVKRADYHIGGRH